MPAENINLLKSRIKNIMGVSSVEKIEPIGNHELKRHFVYKFSIKDEDYVIKIYHRKNRWNREVASLNFFADTGILAPVIIEYGIFEDGTEWLIYEYIEGELLNSIGDEIENRNYYEIYKKIGRQLAQIHYYKEFDFYGNMSEKGLNQGFSLYRDYFEYRMKVITNELHTFRHERASLIEEAIERIKSMYNLLDEVNIAYLCHNDFDERNILVEKNGASYQLKAIIDFEQCVPDDPDKELIYVYLPLFKRDRALAESFQVGYEEFGNISLERLLKKEDFYNLYKGISICAWSKDVDYAYYLSGIKLLENVIMV